MCVYCPFIADCNNRIQYMCIYCPFVVHDSNCIEDYFTCVYYFGFISSRTTMYVASVSGFSTLPREAILYVWLLSCIVSNNNVCCTCIYCPRTTMYIAHVFNCPCIVPCESVAYILCVVSLYGYMHKYA